MSILTNYNENTHSNDKFIAHLTTADTPLFDNGIYVNWTRIINCVITKCMSTGRFVFYFVELINNSF